MNISDRVTIVTGGAVRLGAAICRELSEAGSRIVCQYYSSETDAFALQREIEGRGGLITLVKADLRDRSAPESITASALSAYGKIDILINNAAVFFRTPFGEVTEHDWDTFHDLNLKRVFFLTQAIAEIMKEQGSGKIINIGDSSALSPWPSYIPYATSKAGLIAMTIGLAKALAPEIQVNCINPGPVMMPEDMSNEERRFAADQTLLKREGSALDIARTVRFLIEGSDYITGAVIPVDGGRQVR